MRRLIVGLLLLVVAYTTSPSAWCALILAGNDSAFFSVDPITGTPTYIRNGVGPFAAMAFDSSSGVLYAGNDSAFFSVDPTTGTPTYIRNGVGPFAAMAFGQAPVPEPTALIVWSLLGTLVITAGWWRRRK